MEQQMRSILTLCYRLSNLINRDFRLYTHRIFLAFAILSPAVAYVWVFKLYVLKLKIMETCNGIKFGSKLLIEIRHQQIHATRKRLKLFPRLIRENNSSQGKLKSSRKLFLLLSRFLKVMQNLKIC